MKIKERAEGLRIEMANGASVEALLDGKTFRGLGRVLWGKRALRSPELPILPMIATADGHTLCRLELDEVAADGDDLRLGFRPYFHLCDGAKRHTGADGSWVWLVAPWGGAEERDRGGRLWLTLREVNRITDGMELAGFSYAYLFRSRKHRPWCIHDRSSWELNGRATGNTLIQRSLHQPALQEIRGKGDAFTTAPPGPSQFLPLFSELQGFTFQFDRRGLLVTAHEAPFPCRSIVQKNAGAACIMHLHEPVLTGRSGEARFGALPLEVLYAEARTADVNERINQYDRVRAEIYGRYRDAVGAHGDQTPCVISVDAGALFAGRRLKQQVDRIALTGASAIMLTGLYRPDEDESGVPAALAARVKEAADLARRHGMDVGVAVEGGALPAGDDGRALRRLLTRMKREMAVGALYLDGQAPAIGALGMRDEAALQASCQQKGFRAACSRGGVLGVAGVAVPYELLRGRELLFRDRVMAFPAESVAVTGDDPVRAYFRGYASRVCYALDAALGDADAGPTEPFAAVNRAYRAVSEHMERPRLLSEERGVFWEGGTGEVGVLWACEGFDWLAGEDSAVYDVMAGRKVALDGGACRVEAGHVYLVQGALAP